MRADIVAGAVFPDYELTDHAGKRRKLSDLQGPDPMILVLSRGGFCPKDRRQAEGLVQLHHEMEVGYSRLVTISTDNMLLTNEYRDGVGAHWTFLSDPGRKVQKDLDRKSTRLNSSHGYISYAVFCLKKKKKNIKCINRNTTKRTSSRGKPHDCRICL